MKIQEFIEKAVAGGWNKYAAEWHDALGHGNVQCLAHILLDPLAWQAVGKVEGWSEAYEYSGTDPSDGPDVNGETPVYVNSDHWKARMHAMIDALAEGKTVEQYLETL
jgi:hypothetical protein